MVGVAVKLGMVGLGSELCFNNTEEIRKHEGTPSNNPIPKTKKETNFGSILTRATGIAAQRKENKIIFVESLLN